MKVIDYFVDFLIKVFVPTCSKDYSRSFCQPLFILLSADWTQCITIEEVVGDNSYSPNIIVFTRDFTYWE